MPADGNGSGATATSTINGSVVSITLNNPGSGYVTAPIITFTGGGGSGAAATASLSNGQIIITALGDQEVSNNGYSGPMASTAPFNKKTIKRHYGFGGQCITPDGSADLQYQVERHHWRKGCNYHSLGRHQHHCQRSDGRAQLRTAAAGSVRRLDGTVR